MPWTRRATDEAHKLRNAYRESANYGQQPAAGIGRPQEAAAHGHAVAELLLELFGLSTLIDENLFGDLPSFRTQYTSVAANSPNCGSASSPS
ncbi:MAG: hypothetical protein R2818_13015 [Flavobacteriales bacterium]